MFTSMAYNKLLIKPISHMRQYRYVISNRYKLKKQIQSAKSLNIILGAGSTTFQGWISTDLPLFDILNYNNWRFLFSNREIDHVLAEHVLEHLSKEQVRQVLIFVYQYLKRGASFRIAVPDAFHTSQLYISAVRPGGWDSGAEDHKSFWNYDSICAIGKEVGFHAIGLEYFTNIGTFMYNNYNNSRGFVMRSKLNNFEYKPIPGYTSLIVDLIKP